MNLRRVATEPRRLAARFVLVVGVVLWVGLPVVLVTRVRDVAASQALRTTQAALVPIRAAAATQEQPVGLHFVWAPVPDALAPNWTGLVDAVALHTGSVVRDGDAVMSIDRGQRVAMAASRPLTRPLAYSATGADVADLNGFLRRHGYEASQGDRFGATTERGVKRYALEHGLEPNGFFMPAWVVFLPVPEATVAKVSATVGAPAPSAGTSLLTFAARLETVRLVSADEAEQGSDGDLGSPAPSGGPTAGENGSTGDADATAAEQARLGRLAAVTAPRGSVVRIDGPELALAADRRELAPAAVARMAKQHDQSEPYVRATLVTKRGAHQFAVPAGAVFADSRSSSMCVITSAHGRRRAVAVMVVDDDDSGSAIVAGPIPAAAAVVVGAPRSERSCR